MTIPRTEPTLLRIDGLPVPVLTTHTVVVGTEKYALHLLPSGILSPGCTPVIANGVVVDLSVLFEEIEGLEARGVSCEKLVLSADAHLIASYNRTLDRVAERFLGVPYLWGGKTALGLDCSGLVQVSLAAAGIAAPRDSDMQEAALGVAVPLDPAGFRRGDLLYWKGHAGIACGDGTVVHANAHYMAVAIEPVAELLARTAAAGAPLRSVRRL